MLVELHTHTHYSRGTRVKYDGIDSPEKMVKHAKKLGIDAINISDHNTIQGAIKAKKIGKDILVIIGEEINTDSGDVIAVGIQEEIPRGVDFFDVLDNIHEQGGIAIAAHPFFGYKNYSLGKLAEHCDAVEVFNCLNRDRISNKKCLEFVKRTGMPAVAGSDAHCAEMLGHGLNYIQAQDLDGILKEIEKGRVKINVRYIPLEIMQKWVVRKIQMSYDHVTNYMNSHYSFPKRVLGRNFIKLARKSPGRVDYLLKLMTYAFYWGSYSYMHYRDLKGRASRNKKNI